MGFERARYKRKCGGRVLVRFSTMSRSLAQSGIEKWTVDTGNMTLTFYDNSGGEMLVEEIERPLEDQGELA